MFYRYPQKGEITPLNIESIDVIAVFHTAGAFLLLAFVIVHLYLITTGTTITSNLKAMITGYEELDEEHDDHVSLPGQKKNEVNENGKNILAGVSND